jgi:hypothetical protein
LRDTACKVDAARGLALSTHPIGRLAMPRDIAKDIVLSPPTMPRHDRAGLAVDGRLRAQ